MAEEEGADAHPGRNGVNGATAVKVTFLLLLFLLLVKVYGVARFSVPTASRLATAAPLSVVLGTLALYEYAFMAVAAAAGVLLFLGGLFSGGGLRQWAPLSLVTGVFAALITPLLYLAWAGGAAAVTLVLWAALRRWLSLPRLALYVAAPLLAGFVLVTLGRPWVPAEVVTLSSPVVVSPQTKETASRPVVYVISQDNGWVTMLVDSDRYLAVVPAATVRRQRVCAAGALPGAGQTLYQHLAHQPSRSPELACWQLTDQPEEQG